MAALGRVCRTASVPLLLALVAVSADPGVIRITWGDTLWDLATRHHTSVATLKRLNHLPSDTIYAGQSLLVPAAGPLPQAGDAVAYRVRRGDTVSAIAARHGVTVRAVAARNDLHGRMMIYVGQILHVPVPGSPGRPAGGPNPGPEPAASGAPSREHIRALIRRTADELGVDAALALAVAEQESGFRMNVVSSAGAIGAMQVMPATGHWLSTDVVRRELDLRDAHDNVLAGVALLRLLTHEAPLRQAIAGYYQGLQSVRTHGMYEDTERYVANVMALRARWR